VEEVEAVFIDTEERWAVAMFYWDEQPSLGIRWFQPGKGHPTPHGYPTWFVLPGKLHGHILLALGAMGLKPEDRKIVDEFLSGK
jgi:hypothetical protein